MDIIKKFDTYLMFRRFIRYYFGIKKCMKAK